MSKSTVGVNLLSRVILLLSSVSINAQEIVQHPMSTTVCEGNTATFTCVIFYPSGAFAAAPLWNRNGVAINQVDMIRHNIVDNLTDPTTPVYASSTLTISGTSTVFDDGIMYQCGISATISNIATLNVAGPPSAVSNIRFDEVCTTSVTVSWNPSTSNSVCGPLNYTVSQSPDVNQGPFTTSDTSISLTGLAINNFLVTILSTNMAGSRSSLAETITLPNIADAVPGGVTNLRNTSFATSSADIAWDAAAPVPNINCGPVLYYTIFITDGNTDHVINSTGLTTTITELMSNTTYNIRVVAFNKVEGGMSDTIFITTAATGSLEPANNNNGGGSSGGLSGGAIASIFLGVIVGVEIVIIIVCVYRKMRNKNNISTTTEDHSRVDTVTNDTEVKSQAVAKIQNSEESTEVVQVIDEFTQTESVPIWLQKGILLTSPDPSSPNKKKVTSNEPKGKATKPSKQKDKQANKTEYAELQLSNTGTAPSVDPTKVDYTAVKEHEPLSYAEVQHDKRAGEKPIQGALQVEYKEVWHQ